MAKLTMEWKPESEDEYTEKTASVIIDDDANVEEMFKAWKDFMSFLGYQMANYYISR